MDDGRNGSRRRTARFATVREEIIDVSAKLFASNGYTETGVVQIGEATQLARGALYYYIESKEALLAAIHDRVMDPLLSEGEAIRGSSCSASAKLYLLSNSLMAHIIERREHVWVFLHEYRQLTGERRQRFREKRLVYENLIADILRDGVEKDRFDIDNLKLATMAFLSLHNYTYQWIAGAPEMEASYLANVYSKLFIRGISVGEVDFFAIVEEADGVRSSLLGVAPAGLGPVDGTTN